MLILIQEQELYSNDLHQKDIRILYKFDASIFEKQKPSHCYTNNVRDIFRHLSPGIVTKSRFLRRNAWTGTITAQGPPWSCRRDVGSSSLKTKPVTNYVKLHCLSGLKVNFSNHLAWGSVSLTTLQACKIVYCPTVLQLSNQRF